MPLVVSRLSDGVLIPELEPGGVDEHEQISPCFIRRSGQQGFDGHAYPPVKARGHFWGSGRKTLLQWERRRSQVLGQSAQGSPKQSRIDFFIQRGELSETLDGVLKIDRLLRVCHGLIEIFSTGRGI